MEPDSTTMQKAAAARSKIIVTVTIFMAFNVLLTFNMFIDDEIPLMILLLSLLLYAIGYTILFFILKSLFKKGSLHTYTILKTIGIMALTFFILKVVTIFLFLIFGKTVPRAETPASSAPQAKTEQKTGDFIDTSANTYYNYTYQYSIGIPENAEIEHSNKNSVDIFIPELAINIGIEPLPTQNTSIWEVIDIAEYEKMAAEAGTEQNMPMTNLSIKKVHFNDLEAFLIKYNYTVEEEGQIIKQRKTIIQFVRRSYIYTITINTVPSGPGEEDWDYRSLPFNSFSLL